MYPISQKFFIPTNPEIKPRSPENRESAIYDPIASNSDGKNINTKQLDCFIEQQREAQQRKQYEYQPPQFEEIKQEKINQIKEKNLELIGIIRKKYPDAFKKALSNDPREVNEAICLLNDLLKEDGYDYNPNELFPLIIGRPLITLKSQITNLSKEDKVKLSPLYQNTNYYLKNSRLVLLLLQGDFYVVGKEKLQEEIAKIAKTSPELALMLSVFLQGMRLVDLLKNPFANIVEKAADKYLSKTIAFSFSSQISSLSTSLGYKYKKEDLDAVSLALWENVIRYCGRRIGQKCDRKLEQINPNYNLWGMLKSGINSVYKTWKNPNKTPLLSAHTGRKLLTIDDSTNDKEAQSDPEEIVKVNVGTEKVEVGVDATIDTINDEPKGEEYEEIPDSYEEEVDMIKTLDRQIQEWKEQIKEDEMKLKDRQKKLRNHSLNDKTYNWALRDSEKIKERIRENKIAIKTQSELRDEIIEDFPKDFLRDLEKKPSPIGFPDLSETINGINQRDLMQCEIRNPDYRHKPVLTILYCSRHDDPSRKWEGNPLDNEITNPDAGRVASTALKFAKQLPNSYHVAYQESAHSGKCTTEYVVYPDPNTGRWRIMYRYFPIDQDSFAKRTGSEDSIESILYRHFTIDKSFFAEGVEPFDPSNSPLHSVREQFPNFLFFCGWDNSETVYKDQMSEDYDNALVTDFGLPEKCMPFSPTDMSPLCELAYSKGASVLKKFDEINKWRESYPNQIYSGTGKPAPDHYLVTRFNPESNGIVRHVTTGSSHCERDSMIRGSLSEASDVVCRIAPAIEDQKWLDDGYRKRLEIEAYMASEAYKGKE